MTHLKKCFCLTQAPILQCKYAEIKELQRRLLERVYDKVFICFSQKGHFYQKHCGTAKTKYKP